MADIATEAKVEFGTAAFLEALRAIFEDIGGRPEHRGVVFSLSEAYRGVPAHLSADGTGGFTVRMRDGRVAFTPEPSADVDVRVDGEFATMLPLARFVVGDDPARRAEMNRMIGAAIQAGTFKVTGDATKLPTQITGEVHDRVARITA